MRDPKRIPRVLRKLEKTWKKYPDMRLIQLLHYLVADPEKRLDPFYIEDRHLEEILDGKVPKTKLKIMTEHLFEMTYLMSDGKAREVTDAFLRDVRTSTLNELMGNEAVLKMNGKGWYAVKLEGYRIVFRIIDRSTIELRDLINEQSILLCQLQNKKEEVKA